MTSINAVQVFFAPVIADAQSNSREPAACPDPHRGPQIDSAKVLLEFVIHVLMGAFLYVVCSLPSILIDVVLEKFAAHELAVVGLVMVKYVVVGGDVLLLLVYMFRVLAQVLRDIGVSE